MVIVFLDYDLWGAVPPRLDRVAQATLWPLLLSDVRFLLLEGVLNIGVYGPGQTKITQFDLALVVDENIWGFQIPMNHISRMEIVHAAQDIVQDDESMLFQKHYVCPSHQFEEAWTFQLHHKE